MQVPRGILSALVAAALFGVSTPIAKTLLGELAPVMLAGLLYLGSGIGLAVGLIVRAVIRRHWTEGSFAWPRGVDVLWLALSIFFGGVLGPILLLIGLASTAASITALLLNLEGVFTAVLAWFVFRENVDRRVALGMALIVLGGVVLSWTSGPAAASSGAYLITTACLCWAIDNNLTRKVAASDAMAIACIKGLVAGTVNVSAAVFMGASLPSLSTTISAALLGLASYGVSLTLFVFALRELGTARTSAYFSVAPFFGAALALVLQNEPLTAPLAVAATAMAWGVWLHVSERHQHMHWHEHLEHSHAHVHDAHHRHRHDFAWEGDEPHTHPHVHERQRHAHRHYPDIHHRHEH
jgi:drug/metabolite transporter (DMT)-like permease